MAVFLFFFHPPLCVCVFACVEMEGGGCETQVQQGGGAWFGAGGPADVAEGGFFVPLPTLCSPPADPLRLTGGLLLSSQERDGWVGGGSEVVLLPSSLERARQFVKAFGERGGNLHVT